MSSITLAPESQIKVKLQLLPVVLNIWVEKQLELAKLEANLFLHYRLDANQAETFKQELTKEFPDLKLKFMVVNWIKLKI